MRSEFDAKFAEKTQQISQQFSSSNEVRDLNQANMQLLDQINQLNQENDEMLSKISVQNQQLAQSQDMREKLVQLEDELETNLKTIEYY